MFDLRNAVVKRVVGDAELAATVSPCTWMYKTPFQVTVSMSPGGGKVTRRQDGLCFDDATEEDMVKLLDQVQVVPCKKCGKPAFDPDTEHTNREGECEPCWMAKWRADFEKMQEEERKRLAELDAKRKQEGYTHRISAWVHPESGGDDYPVSFWMVNPTDQQIRTALQKEGSSVLTDYQVMPL